MLLMGICLQHTPKKQAPTDYKVTRNCKHTRVLPLKEGLNIQFSLTMGMPTHIWEGWGSLKNIPVRLYQEPVQARLENKKSIKALYSLFHRKIFCCGLILIILTYTLYCVKICINTYKMLQLTALVVLGKGA
jgi:hypothetical protein